MIESRKNYHKFMQWDITQRCNLRCIHCRSTEFYSDSHIIDLPMVANKEIAEELYLNGVRRIHFLGGEPLIRKDFCSLAEYLTDLGIGWSVNTNATLLTEEIAQRLLDSEALVITISLDGPDAESNDAVRGQGVFEKVYKNTACLTKLRDRQGKKTSVVISCTLFKDNVGLMKKMVKLVSELHINNLIISGLLYMGRAKQNYNYMCVDFSTELVVGEELARNTIEGCTQNVQLGFLSPLAIQYLNEEFGTDFPIYDASCSALTHQGFIQPDGALFPCQALADAANIPKVMLPLPRRSLIEYSFDEIWNSPEMQRIGNLLTSRRVDKLMLPCHYCHYFRLLCNPCPLGPLKKKPSVKFTCLEAMTRLSKRRGYDAPWRELVREMSDIKNKSVRPPMKV